MYPAMKVRKSVGNLNFILSQTYVSNDESSRKCRKACEAYGETPEIRNPNKHMGFDKLKFEGCPMVKSLGETPMIGFSKLALQV